MEIRQSVVCPGCGCLCDDLDVSVHDNRISEVTNVCLWGTGRFFGDKRGHPKKARHRLTEPQVRRRGRREAATYETALAVAADWLRQARRPVIYGLTNCGSGAQEAALELARRAGARLEPADLAFKAPYFQAIQEAEVFWAPLEVIRDEADTFLFWGANPLHSCPRHVVRYSAFARGRFTEGGLEERRVAAVDIARTEMAEFCHLFIRIEPERELELLNGVMAACLDDVLPAVRPKGTKRLAQMLQQAAYGVLFVGRGVSYGPAADRLWTALVRLTSELNRQKPFILFPLSGDYNSWGLYHLLLRETGAPWAPEFRPGGEVETYAEPVDFSGVDAVVVAGADLLWNLSPEKVQDLKKRRVPLVVLSPFANQTTAQAAVVLPVALDGVEAAERAFRMDGLPVDLKKILDSPAPPTWEVFRDLAAHL